MNTVQKNRLLKLIEKIKTIKAKEFNPQVYWNFDIYNQSNCFGCALGWAGKIQEFIDEGYNCKEMPSLKINNCITNDVYEISEHFFGIKAEDHISIFGQERISRKEWIDRVETLIKEYEIND